MEYRKNFLWNTIGAGANAFISLFLIIFVTRINGLNEAGIFSYCFATACLLYCIGNYAGRVFQVTDRNTSISDYDYIQNRIITCVLMIIATVIFAFINPEHTFYKAIILILLSIFKCVEAFSEVLYGIVQKNNQLYKVGISMTLKAVLSLAIFFIIDILTRNLLYSCISIIFTNLLILFTYDYYNIKKVNVEKNKFNKESNKNIFYSGFFTFLLFFLSIYLINISRYTINNISTDELQTIFGIIIMPATFMGLIGQFIIQPFLVRIKELLINNDYNNLLKIILRIVFAIFIISIVVLVCAYFLATPVLGFIYGIDLAEYKISLMIILTGAVFYSLSVIFSAILVSMRKTLSQAIIYSLVAVIGTIISYPFVKNYSIIGASITYLITMFSVSGCFAFIIGQSIFKSSKRVKGMN